jgi:hypothetical protein
MRSRLWGPAAGLASKQPGRQLPGRVSSWDSVVWRSRKPVAPSRAFMGPRRCDQAGKSGVVRERFIERYLYRPIDTRARLSGMEIQPAPLEAEYARLRARLARLGWISHGYVQDRGPGAGGPCYQWTRKVKGKTVSVALSQAQYQALQAAIVNWKETQEILQRMQALSREVIFRTLPHPPRRKRLGKKVLGII